MHPEYTCINVQIQKHKCAHTVKENVQQRMNLRLMIRRAIAWALSYLLLEAPFTLLTVEI